MIPASEMPSSASRDCWSRSRRLSDRARTCWSSVANRRRLDDEETRMPLLFSYGTLQREDVQLSTFGRLLVGHPDELVGFEQGLLRIEDPEFVAASGKADHAVVRYNGDDESRVGGTVFEITDSELAGADGYEPAGYKRVTAVL